MAAAEPPARRRRGLLLAGVLAAAAAIVVLAIVLSSGGGGKPKPKRSSPPAVQSSSPLAGIPQSGIALGSATAPATLIEFADLQCPYCQQYTTSVQPALIQRYVRTGKLQMQFRNLSFLGPDSVTAGRWASAAAQQNKLWNFLESFFANQGQENSGYITDGFLRRIAATAGLNVPAAAAYAASAAARQPLNQANQLATSSRVDSTPSFLLGRTGGAPKRFNGNIGVADMARAIDAQLQSGG